MDIERIEKHIDLIDEEIELLLERAAPLKRHLAKAKSIKFIEENKITRDQVQRHDEYAMPCIRNVWTFAKWMEENSNKKWFCWNEILYRSSEIIAGRMDHNAVGRFEDLPS